MPQTPLSSYSFVPSPPELTLWSVIAQATIYGENKWQTNVHLAYTTKPTDRAGHFGASEGRVCYQSTNSPLECLGDCEEEVARQPLVRCVLPDNLQALKMGLQVPLRRYCDREREGVMMPDVASRQGLHQP